MVLKGIILAILIGLLSLFLSQFISIGSVAIAIIIGVLITNLVKLDSSFDKGISFSEKKILAFAIATLGINLDFSFLLSLGIKSIVLIVAGMVITIFSAIIIGKIFKIDSKFALLLGIGNGVCGASAIGAVKKVIEPKSEFVGISVAIVNLLGAIGMFLVPLIALFFSLDDKSSGILVGNTLQAVGQAVAGGFAISDTAGNSATIVKMGRVLLLAPVLFILILIFHKNSDENSNVLKNIPQFIYWFIFFSLLKTFHILPNYIEDIISHISHYLLIVAMAGVGLKIHFTHIKSHGKVALIIGSIVFIIQIVFSLLFLKFV